MKTNNKVFKIAGYFIAALLVITFAGCFSGLEPQGIRNLEGKGTVKITIGAADGRTALPAGDFTYRLTGEMTGTAITIDEDFDKTNSIVIDLEVGTWNLTVERLFEGNVVGYANLFGIEITENGLVTLTANIVPKDNDVDGKLKLTMLLEGSLIFDELDSVLLFIDDDLDGIDLLDFISEDNDNEIIYEEDLSPGSYIVRAVLKKDSKRAGYMEAVHIYSGMPTAVNWTFFETSFVDVRPISGSIIITPSVNVDITGAVIHVTGTHPRDLVKGTGNEWTFTGIEVPVTAVKVSGDITITTASNTVTYSFTEEDIDADDDTVDLGEVKIHALTGTVSGNGTFTVNTAAITDDFQIDYLDGVAITLAANAAAGHKVAVFTVDGEDYAAFTMDASKDVEVSFVPWTAVSSIVIKDGDDVLEAFDLIELTVDGEPVILNVTVGPALALTTADFAFDVISTDLAEDFVEVDVDFNNTTGFGTITLTPIAETDLSVGITVRARNDVHEAGAYFAFTFDVAVEEAITYELVRAPTIGSGANGGSVISASYDNDILTLIGNGRLTSGTNVGGGFIYTDLTGDFIAEIDLIGHRSLQTTNNVNVGLFIMGTKPASGITAYPAAYVGKNNNTSNQDRVAHGIKPNSNAAITLAYSRPMEGTSNRSFAPPSAANPWHIKVIREGNTITASVTANITTGVPITVDGIDISNGAFGNTVYLGPIASSDPGDTGRSTGLFTNFKITQNGNTVDVSFNQEDILNEYTPVSNIVINDGNFDLVVGGGTKTLSADLTPGTATEKEIVWTTGNAAVATVTQTGVVTAVGAGSTNITVTSLADNSKNASVTVTVTAPSLSLSAEGNKTIISAGDTAAGALPQTLQFAALEGSTNVSSEATWYIKDSSNFATGANVASGIANISNTGLLTAGINLTSDVDIWVFAEKGSVVTDGYKVTIGKYEALRFNQVKVGTATGTTSQVYSNNVLTMQGTGTINNSGNAFNYVYLPAVAGDFTITAKMKYISSTGSASNNERAGIMAIAASSTTGQFDNLTIPDDNSALMAATARRNDPSWGRFIRGDGSNAGNLGFTAFSSAPSTDQQDAGVTFRLRRVGDNWFSAWFNTTTSAWVESGPFQSGNSIPNKTWGHVYIGLFVSANGNNTATVEFNEVMFANGNGNATGAELTNIDHLLSAAFGLSADIDITINPDAPFVGFPTAPFVLSKSAAGALEATLAITLADYDTGTWLINGRQVATGKTYTVNANAGNLAVGPTHNLTVFITAANGERYSKSVTFTVTE